MRTTVDINDELLQIARKRAADEHATLREVFDRALGSMLRKARRENSSFIGKPTREAIFNPEWFLKIEPYCSI
jgi:hypothetical protein